MSDGRPVELGDLTDLADRDAPVELGDLTWRAGNLPDEAVTVMCGHGERAMTAATILERTGNRESRVLVGGAEDWSDATGRALRTGG